MSTNAHKMKIDFEALALNARVKIETFMHEFGQSLAEQAVTNTPVDTGFLRGSWYARLNDPVGGTSAAQNDKSGAMTIAEINLVVGAMSAGDTVYLVNGAKYARFVEYGTSRMAPRGFVRKTVAQAPRIAEETMMRIKRGFGR